MLLRNTNQQESGTQIFHWRNFWAVILRPERATGAYVSESTMIMMT
jgi:hypothetical protein